MGQSAHKKYFRRNALLRVGLVFGIVLLLNIIVRNQFVGRFDLTADKEYTITEATKKILNSIEGLFRIKAYISRNVPPNVVLDRQRVIALLEEYQAYAQGNLKIEWIDPSEGRARKEAEDAGIQFFPVQALEGDRMVTQQIAMGAVLQYQAQQKLIPMILPSNVPTMEYDLTVAVKSMLEPKRTRVGLLTSNGPPPAIIPGAPNIANSPYDYLTVRQFLQQRYVLSDVMLKEGGSISADIDILLVMRPKNITAWEQFQMDQFLMRGGRIMFLVDRAEYPAPSFARQEIFSGLDDLFGHYGFQIEDDLVFDRSCLAIRVPKGEAQSQMRKVAVDETMHYPFWVQVLHTGFSTENPITSGIDSLSLFWVSPLKTVASPQKNTHGETLVYSSEVSWLTGPMENVFPDKKNLQQILDQAKNKNKAQEHPLALAISGEFISYYADKSPPDVEPPAAETGPANASVVSEVIKKSPATRMLVVSDADFVADGSSPQTNLIFFLNAVDWLALDQDLITIRSKNSRDRRIINFEAEYEKEIGATSVQVEKFNDVFSENYADKVETARTNRSEIEEKAQRTRDLIKWSNLVGIPLAVVLAGILRFVVRAKRRRNYFQRQMLNS